MMRESQNESMLVIILFSHRTIIHSLQCNHSSTIMIFVLFIALRSKKKPSHGPYSACEVGSYSIDCNTDPDVEYQLSADITIFCPLPSFYFHLSDIMQLLVILDFSSPFAKGSLLFLHFLSELGQSILFRASGPPHLQIIKLM